MVSPDNSLIPNHLQRIMIDEGKMWFDGHNYVRYKDNHRFILNEEDVELSMVTELSADQKTDDIHKSFKEIDIKSMISTHVFVGFDRFKRTRFFFDKSGEMTGETLHPVTYNKGDGIGLSFSKSLSRSDYEDSMLIKGGLFAFFPIARKTPISQVLRLSEDLKRSTVFKDSSTPVYEKGTYKLEMSEDFEDFEIFKVFLKLPELLKEEDTHTNPLIPNIQISKAKVVDLPSQLQSKGFSKEFEIGPFTFKINEDIVDVAEKLQQLKDYMKESSETEIKNLAYKITEHLRNKNMQTQYMKVFKHVVSEAGDISQKTVNAIKKYTGSSYSYTNRYLRGTISNNDLVKEGYENVVKTIIKDLDDAYENESVVLKNSGLTLYRGQTISPEEVISMENTKQYSAEGYMSTSFSPSVAYCFLKTEGKIYTDEFLHTYEGRHHQMLVIKDVHRVPVLIPGYHSDYKEAEIIFPRNTLFKVLKNVDISNADKTQTPTLMGRFYYTTVSVQGVGGISISAMTEKAKMTLFEMVEAGEEERQLANEILITDTLLDIVGEGAMFDYTDNQELLDSIVKWTEKA